MSKLTAQDTAAMKKMAGSIPQDEPPALPPVLARPVTTSHNGRRSVGTHTRGVGHINPGGKPGESGVSLAKRVLKQA